MDQVKIGNHLMQETHNVFQTWTSWQLNCSSSSSLAFLWIYGSNTKDIPWVLFITELAWTLLVIKLILQLVPESFGMIMDIWQLTAVIKKLYPNCLFATFWKKWKIKMLLLDLNSHCNPVQGQYRARTGFSLLEIQHRENPVFITGMGLQCSFYNRFWKYNRFDGKIFLGFNKSSRWLCTNKTLLIEILSSSCMY